MGVRVEGGGGGGGAKRSTSISGRARSAYMNAPALKPSWGDSACFSIRETGGRDWLCWGIRPPGVIWEGSCGLGSWGLRAWGLRAWGLSGAPKGFSIPRPSVSGVIIIRSRSMSPNFARSVETPESGRGRTRSSPRASVFSPTLPPSAKGSGFWDILPNRLIISGRDRLDIESPNSGKDSR